jgi:hypothetical protein
VPFSVLLPQPSCIGLAEHVALEVANDIYNTRFVVVHGILLTRNEDIRVVENHQQSSLEFRVNLMRFVM